MKKGKEALEENKIPAVDDDPGFALLTDPVFVFDRRDPQFERYLQLVCDELFLGCVSLLQRNLPLKTANCPIFTFSMSFSASQLLRLLPS